MVKVKGLSKRFVTDRGDVRAVESVSFEVPEGRFYTLLGPSGCGKTTTLRCIAGLERPDAGEISIGNDVVSSSEVGVFVPPYKRNIGMVFQSYAIWPHLTVFDNVAFPLRVGKTKYSSGEVRAKVRKALEVVRLASLEDRPAPQLSGGQQQRLALARALVREPKLLLLDEPLSNLDAKLRESMRVELRELQRQLGITTIYVTHDQTEALAMSNVIAVMQDGRIAQEGPPREIYDKPEQRFVADFVGSTNFIAGRVVEANADSKMHVIESAIGSLGCCCPGETTEGSEVLVSVRPESVVLHQVKPEKARNVFEGTVRMAIFLGEYVDYQVLVAQQIIHAREHPTLEVKRGDKIYLEMPVERCMVVPTGNLVPRFDA
ncbi:MAG: ABC transporter ATP-binding protein [Chloroflexi bacterium]|nr:ABC transporter ATP-binding protein [Chloroflexota bacterium]